MHIVRAIFAVLIAISVAVLPVTGGAAISTKPVEMSMADNGDMPCCPCCSAQDDLKGSVSCAMKCINFFGAILPPIISLPHSIDTAPQSFVADALQGHVRSPPTHPPPV